jgi:hypothetical protein
LPIVVNRCHGAAVRRIMMAARFPVHRATSAHPMFAPDELIAALADGR